MSASVDAHTPDYGYVYTPLDVALLDEIRLIRLWPGPIHEEDIRLEVFHEIASAKPQYEALSYAWGCSDLTDIALVCEAVACRGKRKDRRLLEQTMDESIPTSKLGIAHNLAVALRHLRFPDRERILWVDAISINQRDDTERSREVLKMGALYRNAKGVVVWLGPSLDDSTLALKTLARLGADVIYHNDKMTVGFRSAASWAEFLAEDEQALRAQSPSWVAIGRLLRREWFKRLWVFQEIALASSSIVLAGEYFIDWELFRLGLYWVWLMINNINRIPDAPNIDNPGTNCVFGLLEISDRNATIRTTLINALSLTKRVLCFDERDRLFGIREILIVNERKYIEPDYSLDTEEAFTATTMSWINDYGRLDILKFCVLQSPFSDLKLPSWVPDFSFQGRPEQIMYTRADGFAYPNHSIDNGAVLTVYGVKVTEVTQVVAKELTRESTDMELLGVCCAWRQYFSHWNVEAADESTGDAFVEAVMGGRIQEMTPINLGVFPSHEVCKQILREAGEEFGEARQGCLSKGPDRDLVIEKLRYSVFGRAMFSTAVGTLGMCPNSVQCGDIIVVVLGCNAPLVLRPQPDGVDTFKVVGECYVPSFMNAEALLGPLPPGWTKRKLVSKYLGLIMMYEQGQTKTQEDPRTASFPSDWRIMFGTRENPLEVEPEDENDWEFRWFENMKTGEQTSFNPAITPSLLKERGVDIRQLRLI
ncbi:hypothetical protein ONS96_008369 [Cadophora gregata f. sp. sojae]|nr:hypothetical protein ONS96_008369 [Cadophora gregata f. sp. sojae]